MRHYRDDNTEGYTQAQLDALNAELDGRLDGIEPGSDEWHETVSRHADEVARRTPQVALASAAARTLRAIPSEARSEQSRSNGRRGGRPARYVLVDDLGRCVGDTITRAGQAGTRVEYGWRGDGVLRVEGIAKLVRPSEWDGYTPERRYDC